MCKFEEVLEKTDPETEAMVSQLVCLLAALPPEQRVGKALSMSAQLLEFAAFESATKISSDDVGALIDWAARISRCSHQMEFGDDMASAHEGLRLN